MARGYPGAFGRKVDALYVWMPLCAAVPRAVRRPAPPVPAAAPRPAGAARLLGLAGLLQPRRTSACRSRSPTRRCSTCSCGCSWWRAGAGRRDPPSALRLLVPTTWLRGRARVPRRLPRRAQRHQLERDRRRLRGRDRRRPARRRHAALRPLPAPTTSTATPTGRSTTTRTCRSSRCWPWSGTLGRPAGGARRGGGLRPADAARPVAARAGACAARAWAGCSRTPGRRSRSRCSSSNSNSNDALVAMLLDARAARGPLGAGARRGGGARRADEVRAARAGAAVRHRRAERRRARRAGCAASRCSRSASPSTAAIAMLPVLVGGDLRHVLRPHDRLPARPRLAVLGLGPLRAGTRRRASCRPRAAAFARGRGVPAAPARRRRPGRARRRRS